MPPTVDIAGWPNPGESWALELVRVSEHLRIVCSLVTAAQLVVSGRQDEAFELVDVLERRGQILLGRLHARKPAYLFGAISQEHTGLYSRMRASLAAIQERPELAPIKAVSKIAWII